MIAGIGCSIESDPVTDFARSLERAGAGASATRSATPSRPPLRPDMTVRQVTADYLSYREVVRLHGGPEDRPLKFGPVEPLYLRTAN